MRLRFACFLATTLSFCLLTSAQASTMLESFSISGSGITSSGTLTLTSTGTANVYQITGIAGTYSSAGFSGAITGLAASHYSAASPDVTSNGLSVYDNLFYTAPPVATCSGGPAGSQKLDYCGIDFLVSNTDNVNLFAGNAGSAYALSSSAITGSRYIQDTVPVTFSASAVTPEPSSLMLLGTGVLGVAGVLRRRLA